VVHNLSAIPREICLETGVDDEGFAIPEAVRLCLEQWRREYGNTEESTLMFPAIGARRRKPLDKPMHPDNWLRLRLYPVAKALGLSFHPTFQALRRSFSTHGKRKHTRQRCRRNSGTAISGPRSTSTLKLSVLRCSIWPNEVTNRLLQLGKEAEPGSIQ
jgi:hypothetical protein